jgi:hypothetical protein
MGNAESERAGKCRENSSEIAGRIAGRLPQIEIIEIIVKPNADKV